MSAENVLISKHYQTSFALNRQAPAGILFAMGRSLPILAIVAVAGCPGEIDLRGRPCADEQQCLPDFTCDRAANRCVGTGDPCHTETLLPCEADETVCTTLCRTCLEGAWSECATPKAAVAPALEGVVELCAGQDATVTWAVADNVTYDIEFWDTDAWVTPSTVEDGTATEVGPDVAVDYMWRIRATNALGSSTWHPSAPFGVTAIPTNPLLALVDDLCVGVIANISWSGGTSGTYAVDFWNGVDWEPANSILGNTASSTPPGPGSYRWRLATSVGQCNAEWTESDSFDVAAPPSLYEVRVTTTTDRINGSWRLTPGCSADILMRRGEGTIPTIDGVNVTTSELTFNDTSVIPGPVYYYRPFVDPAGLPPTAGPILCAMVGTTAIHPVHVAEGAITIDGTDTEPAWQLAASIPFDYSQRYTESNGNDLRVKGYIRYAWDDTGFMFFISIDDRYVHVDAADGIEENDGFEIWFDMDFDRSDAPDANDYHFVLVADDSRLWQGAGNGTSWDNTYSATSFVRAHQILGTLNDEGDDDTRWSFEGRISFADLGGAPSPGQTIGFAAWINEDDLPPHDVQHIYDWTEGMVWDDPRTWGVGMFNDL